jgi:hypothetical protein
MYGFEVIAHRWPLQIAFPPEPYCLLLFIASTLITGIIQLNRTSEQPL